MCVPSPQNLYVNILTPKMMVLEVGPFEDAFDHDGGYLFLGSSALIKEALQR